jgi:hypothetical protein
MFQVHSFFTKHSQPIEFFPVTNAEDYAIGQVMALSSGDLTAAGVDSTGAQEFICLQAGTGDGETLVPVLRIQRQMQFKVDVVAGTPALNTKYTLDTNLVGITNTITNGVFKVDEIPEDGVVIGHFEASTDI